MFTTHPEDTEIIIINKKSLSEIINANVSLFEYKLGENVSLESLCDHLTQYGFHSFFKKNIALQGIILGYGTENSTLFESGSSFLKGFKPIPLPPHKMQSQPKNPEEMLALIGDKTRADKIKNMICYSPSDKTDKIKVPFSYIKNSKQSQLIIDSYKKTQKIIDSVLRKQNFLSELFNLFGIEYKSNCSPQTFIIDEFLEPNKENRLSKIVAQSLWNTFPEKISPAFIEGMKDAQEEKRLDRSNIELLDILWKRERLLLEPTRQLFKRLSTNKNAHCLIPQKLYFRILKPSASQQQLTKDHKKIKAKYLIKDFNGNFLTGSYHLEDPPIFSISELIPGLAHGLLGAKLNEIREVYIHPDFVYGTSSEFGSGQAISVSVEIIDFVESGITTSFPSLKPVDIDFYSPEIDSVDEYIKLQNKYAYACGHRVWEFYKRAKPLIHFESVISEISYGKKGELSDSENDLLLNLEWLLYQVDNR